MSTEPSKLSIGFANPNGKRKFIRGIRPGERRTPTPVERSDTGYDSDATEYYGSDPEATNSPIRTFPTSTRESPNFVFETTRSPLNLFRISQNSAFKRSRSSPSPHRTKRVSPGYFSRSPRASPNSPRMSKRASPNSPRMSKRASQSPNRTKRGRQSY